jgi:hypothetical protein
MYIISSFVILLFIGVIIYMSTCSSNCNLSILINNEKFFHFISFCQL